MGKIDFTWQFKKCIVVKRFFRSLISDFKHFISMENGSVFLNVTVGLATLTFIVVNLEL